MILRILGGLIYKLDIINRYLKEKYLSSVAV